MCEVGATDLNKIAPIAIFGFDGTIPFGLKVHPEKKHILFPLGNRVGITTISSNKQEFLCGHTNTVSCLDVSTSGKFIASGQNNHAGFRAYVILWDWESRKEVARHELHKVRVQAICFSSEDKYIISLGGQDDLSIIVYDIESRTPICGTSATNRTAGNPYTLYCLHNKHSVFLACGEKHLRLWHIDSEKRKLIVQDAAVGKLQRRYTGMRIDENDQILYVGTMSGDVMKLHLNCYTERHLIETDRQAVLLGCFGRHNPKRPKGKDCEKYINGVRDIFILKNNQLLIGAGDGTVELVEERKVSFKSYTSPTWPMLKKIKETKVNGAVSAITQLDTNLFLIGTENCEIYYLNITNFNLKLLKTAHNSTVFDIAFPKDFSLVFATASHESIRIWSTTRMQELLRIMVYNFTAASIVFSHDGKSIISAWNDGILRAFTPITGKLIYAIPNAHNKGCSAVTISSTNKVLVSGGIEGQVRVWKIEPHRQSLIGVLKEHSAPVASVDFNKFDTEVVSASSDGTCVIWDIIRLTRKHVLYANTQFLCARYYPTGVQILATGTDSRISYWEVYDGSLAREVQGSTKGTVNSVSLNSSGEYFISVGNDQVLKIWDYQQGNCICEGYGHTAAIVSCRFSPCGRLIVTGSSAGAVFIWNVPEEYWPKNHDPLMIKKKEKPGSSKPLSKSKINENVEELSSKQCGEVVCTECPPVNRKDSPDINESCNMLP